MTIENEHHFLGLSGGKDSTALAFFLKENEPEIFKQLELVFFDTECELEETYDYLNKIEVYLGKKIIRIKPTKSFDHIYSVYGILPSPMRRWCTVEMKTKTFRKYIYTKIKDGKKVNIYIGIRADEPQRVNNSYDTDMIKQIYPFVDNNINKEDVFNILHREGIGVPDYYKWRSRSGCYFCFFQRKIEWVNLYEKHPELYQKALEYEEMSAKQNGRLFTWCSDISLRELIKPENIERIKKSYEKKSLEKDKTSRALFDIMEDDENNCPFCHI